MVSATPRLVLSHHLQIQPQPSRGRKNDAIKIRVMPAATRSSGSRAIRSGGGGQGSEGARSSGERPEPGLHLRRITGGVWGEVSRGRTGNSKRSSGGLVYQVQQMRAERSRTGRRAPGAPEQTPPHP